MDNIKALKPCAVASALPHALKGHASYIYSFFVRFIIVAQFSFAFSCISSAQPSTNWKKYESSSNNFVTAIATKGSHVWAALGVSTIYGSLDPGVNSTIKLVHFDGNQWTEYNSNNSPIGNYGIKDIFIDNNDNVYLATNGGGAYKFNGFTWQNYNTSNSILPTNDINAIAVNSVGDIFVGVSVWDCSSQNPVHAGMFKLSISSNSWTTVGGASLNGGVTDIQLVSDTDFIIQVIASWSSGLSNIGIRYNYNIQTNQLALYYNRVFVQATSALTYTGSGPCGSYFGGGHLNSQNTSNLNNNQYLGVDNQISNCLALTDLNQPVVTNIPAPVSNLENIRNVAFWDNKIVIADYTAGIKVKDAFTWTSYNTSNSALPTNECYKLATDQAGNLWIGTSNGLVKFDGTNFTPYYDRSDNLFLLYQDIRDIESYNSKVYFDEFNRGLIELSQNNCDNIWEVKPHELITATTLDATGNIWTCSALNGSIRKFNIATNNWTIYPPSLTGGLHSWTDIEANTGNIWASKVLTSVSSGGIVKYDGASWAQYFTSNSGLSSNDVYDIEIAPTGKLWISTGGGLCTYDGTNWVNYTFNAGGHNQNLVDTLGNYWFGAGGVLSKFTGTAMSRYNLPTAGNISCIERENNIIWVGTDNYKLFKFDMSSNTWQQITIPLSGSGTIQKIHIDAANNKWLGNGVRVIQYNENGISTGGLSLSTTNYQLTWCGANGSGSIEVQALHGLAPYNYTWSSGPNATTLTGLGSGIYSLTVTDTNGCSLSQQYPIGGQNNSLGSISSTVTPLNATQCTISLRVTSTSPYTITWSTGRVGTSIVVPRNGSAYTYTITDSNGCSETGTVFAGLTGISNLDNPNNINVWPNPSTDIINVELPAASNLPVSVNILDVNGKAVLSKEISQETLNVSLDVSDLPTGLYILQLKNADNSINHSSKVGIVR